MYRNKFDKTGQMSAKGFKAEAVFKANVDSFFETEIVKAKFQDELKHIDFHCDLSFKVDIKSIKDKETVWIELKNVQGRKGWLYGDCTHFAFERPKGFYMVKRDDLIGLVDKLVDMDALVDTAKDCLYKTYSRTKWGRKDLLTKIKPSDLLTLPYVSIKKTHIPT